MSSVPCSSSMRLSAEVLFGIGSRQSTTKEVARLLPLEQKPMSTGPK